MKALNIEIDLSLYRQTLFWNKVWKSKDCWLWSGGLNAEGSYGTFKGHKNRSMGAHVYSWIMHFGDTKGLFVCHKCDVPSCVNPEHLFLGTNQDNMLDCVAKGRHVSGTQRLEPGQSNEVVAMALSGISKDVVAATFGITTEYVCRLVRRGRT